MKNILNETKPKKNSNTFHDSLQSFLNLIKQRLHTQDIINYGLKVFVDYPNAVSSSLFILNQESFEFDYRSSFPFTAKTANIEFFSKLIEIGTISNTLDSGSLTFFELKELSGVPINFIIIPLIASSGVIGIVIVVLNDYENENKISKTLSEQYLLYSQLFASILDNAFLEANLKQARELLEQKVVLRTFSLSQSKRELQTILDSVQAAILVIDRKSNKIINANPTASFIIGELQENIVGRDIDSYFADQLSVISGKDESLLFSRNFESSVKRVSGDLIPILRTTSKIKLGDQNLRIESFFDITDRKKFENALKDANELLELKVEERTEDLQILVHKLKKEVAEREKAEIEVRKMLVREQELNELKSRFLSMISHEFRTPLTIISTSAQILESYFAKLTENEKKEYLRRILKTVDIMKDLLENVLFLGKSDSNMLSYDPKQINIDEFCHNLVEDFSLSLLKKRQVNFVINYDQPIKFLDPKLLRHILINLLTNAVKYSADEKHIEFSVNSDFNKTEFIVRDYGIGIPEDEIEKVFELFHRARNVGTISGTGLGMAIVNKSLELHNGKIELASKLNQGTTIKVIIPQNVTSN